MKQVNKTNSIWILISMIGILFFIILYIAATLLYPGGSQADKNSEGFSWINNYWCNLLNENAINGKPNPARPIALIGMFVLGLTLSIFWYVFPRLIGFGRTGRLIIQFSGILAMAISMFLFTNLHDTVINIAGFFGLVALAGTFTGLYKSKWYGLFWFGIFNLLLMALNNYVYHTKWFFDYLPIIQKVSFASFLLWVCCINACLYRKEQV